MNGYNVKVKKLNDRAIMPRYATEFSAGADICACIDEDIVIPAGCSAMLHTGIAVELPAGTVGLVYARSGMAVKRGLAPSNKVGVIDCDYRGEIMVSLHNHGNEPQIVSDGERIAQLVITPYITADFSEASELSSTVRGSGGFGSTGER